LINRYAGASRIIALYNHEVTKISTVSNLSVIEGIVEKGISKL